MKKTEAKKIVLAIAGALALGTGAFFGYEYVTEPKIVDAVISTDIDAEGKPVDIAEVVAPGDTVYVSGERNRFWINEAEVVWYKGEIETKNRIQVEEGVPVSDAGYFTSELNVPEGLEEGQYGATIYVDGKKIIETKIEFEVEGQN
ncbi:hypothetical protein [Planomicrobium sp. YIM 101495]|uniref:hypothetical protein n=1 Tax=Planomicrobium sp. YIM 101495 TaxID=2665160 RepID=UPI0012BA36D1|nr:hypothetical protein [Planomicrobium sp. YIM 101495]MTD32060.1 hypothetical protein [Planomicrobium sp. YIM 101495]